MKADYSEKIYTLEMKALDRLEKLLDAAGSQEAVNIAATISTIAQNHRVFQLNTLINKKGKKGK